VGWAGTCFGHVFVDSKTSVLLLAALSKVPSFLDDFYILSSSGLLNPIFGLKKIAQNFVGVWGVGSNPVHSSI